MSDWDMSTASLHNAADDDDKEYSDLYSAWIERTFLMHQPRDGVEASIETCNTVPSTCYGQVTFDGTGNAAQIGDTLRAGKPFIRLSSKTNPTDITNLLTQQWGLRLPRMIISVTGGATTFELPPRLDKMIRQGLRKAATSSNAWIVTGGTNIGVMKYVGEAIKDVQTQVTSPLIGIAPWSVINNKKGLAFDDDHNPTKGAIVSYGNPDNFNPPNCSLDRNHTHFILVDNGTVGKFGGEIETRAHIESNVGSRVSAGQFGIDFPVSNVVIAIQGGPGTLGTCREAVRDGIPIVVVNGSGKAADAIAYAYNLKHNAHSHKYSRTGLETLVREQLSRSKTDENVRELVQQVLDCVRNPDQVYVFEVDFYGRHDVGLDVAILDAVLQWESSRIEKGEMEWLVPPSPKDREFRSELRKARLLELALTWDRIDIAREETAKYRVLKNFDEKIAEDDPITQAKARMLKWALINNRKAFVQIFLETMDLDDVTAFLQTPTTPKLTLPSLRNLSHTRSMARASRRNGQKVKWSNLKNRFSVPLPPQLNTEPLPTHCKSILPDIAAVKLFSDLKNYFHSRLTITKHNMEGFQFNIDVDFDNDPDIRRRDELQAEAKRLFTLRGGFNAWHLLSFFDVFFLRYLFAQGYMVSQIPAGERGPPPCHEEVCEGLARAMHLLWAHRMLDDGWTWGSEFNEERKESPLICAYDDQNGDDVPANKRSPSLSEDVKQDMRDHALRFMTTLYESLRIVVWRPNTFEDLFIQMTTGRTPQDRNKFAHLIGLFPGGSYWESDLRRIISNAVHPDATFVELFKLDPFYLLTIWSTMANYRTLALYFWTLTPGTAIPNGLVLALIIRALLEHDDNLPPESIVQFEELRDTVMKDCVDIINHIDQHNSRLAERILKSVSVHAGMMPTTTLAYRVGHEAFVATHAFRRVLNLLWYDNVDPTNGLLKILFAAVCPFYLLIPGEQLDDAHVHGHARRGFLESLKLSLPVRIDTRVAIDANQDGVVDDTDDVYEEIIRDSSIAHMDDANDLGHSKEGRPSMVQQLQRNPTYHAIKLNDSKANIVFRRLYRFYSSPVVGFTLETISFMLLLLLFSYSALLPTTSWRGGITGDEAWVSILTLVWMLILMVEEVRQACDQGLHAWWAQMWNRWDTIIYVAYLIAVGLRFSPRDYDLGRSRYVFSVVAIMLWTRLARHYAVNQDLGPKLIMIQLMVKDIVVFLGLMVLVFAGYSVALYSVLEEDSKWRANTFTEMVFIPYFQIYGELFLEEMRDKTRCKNLEFTDCGGDPGWFAAPLLAAYIMVANILLVNLLIAMMSSTYEAVQSRALELWAYQNLDALFEVKHTWFLPAPLNIFRNVYLGVTWIAGLMRRLFAKSNRIAPDTETKENLKAFRFFKNAATDVESDAVELTEQFWEESLHEDPYSRVMDAVRSVGEEIQLVQRVVLQNSGQEDTLGGMGQSSA